MIRALAICALAGVLGCAADTGGFECERDDQCGTSGMCGVTGYCVFAAAACDSGWRYGDYAATRLSGKCVGDASEGRYGSAAAGSDHTCAVEEAGTVWCWGRNDYGQLGDDSQSDRAQPVRVEGIEGARLVAAGELHTCAVTAGEVWCWGQNENGQVGDGTMSDRHTPRRVATLTDVVELGLGEYHSCARGADGAVWCWGANADGQLGDGTTEDSSVPVRVLGVAGARALAVDGSHSCAQLDDGTAMCWGRNEFGQLGLGTHDSPVSTPVTIPWLANARAIAAGGDHLCGLGDDGLVRCAGMNEYGELGDGSHSDRDTPVEVAGLHDVEQLVAGEWFSCALLADGTASCWGRNGRGELGWAGDDTQPRAGHHVEQLTGILRLAAGERHACAQTADGCLWCWGSDEYGQLGAGHTFKNDDSDAHPTPRAVSLGCW